MILLENFLLFRAIYRFFIAEKACLLEILSIQCTTFSHGAVEADSNKI